MVVVIGLGGCGSDGLTPTEVSRSDRHVVVEYASGLSGVLESLSDSGEWVECERDSDLWICPAAFSPPVVRLRDAKTGSLGPVAVQPLAVEGGRWVSFSRASPYLLGFATTLLTVFVTGAEARRRAKRINRRRIEAEILSTYGSYNDIDTLRRVLAEALEWSVFKTSDEKAISELLLSNEVEEAWRRAAVSRRGWRGRV